MAILKLPARLVLIGKKSAALRAMCAAKAMGWHSEQAKLRQVEAGRFAGRDENGNPVVKEEFQLVAPVQQPEEPAAPAESTPAKEPEVIQPERASAFEQKAISQAGKWRRGKNMLRT